MSRKRKSRDSERRAAILRELDEVLADSVEVRRTVEQVQRRYEELRNELVHAHPMEDFADF